MTTATSFTVTGQRAQQMRVLPGDVLRRLSSPSDAAGFVQTAAHLALLVVGGWLVLATRGTWFVVPALVLQGIFVNALFGAMHESVHYGSFKTRRLADILAFISGAAILNNAAFYRAYHMAHHRYTQDPARDPELITATPPHSWRTYLLRLSALPFLALRARDLACFPMGIRGDVTYIEDAAWREIEHWGQLLIVFYGFLIAASCVFTTDMVLWVWFLPLLCGLPFLRAYLVCEHTLCPNSDDGFANTRTTRSNALVRFLMWNLPYHAEHHLFPSIAFHNLPEAHRLMRPHLKVLAPGYISVHREIIKSFA